MSFRDFDVDPRCLEVLEGQGIVEPTPIQEQTLPVALSGLDVIAIAQTGTGKTLAFTLPALTRVAELGRPRNAMLVLTPTRELAIQVHSVIQPLAKALRLQSACIYGGVGMTPQENALRRGCSIIVATPGRLLDHMTRNNVHFRNLSMLVLDEADRMLDMGFLPDIRRIMRTLPDDRQTLLFSATFPKEIERLVADMLYEPERIQVGAVSTPVDSVRQEVYTVSQTSKLELLTRILNDDTVRSALVFIRTKHRTDRVARALHKQGFKAQAIHGDRSQRQRQQAIEGFRDGRYRILVATDVAARGLDVQGITHVINYDIPATSEEYVHRIGRTARANATGDAITFVSPDDYLELRTIEQSLGRNLERQEWEGAVPVVSLFRPKGEEDSTNHSSRRRRSLFRRR